MKQVKVNKLAFASFLMMTLPAMAAGGGEAGLNPSFTMSALMWGCLLVLLVVGHKIAWKPILNGINEREDKIRTALDDAEKAQSELADIKSQCEKLKAEANSEAKQIITDARDTAKKLAKEIGDEAKADAQSVREGALKDIESAKVDAMQTLRSESAELAISLAGKLLGENLDNEKNRSLTETLINKI
jgi:F-type H+-transporting ATPase subunit b